MGKIQQLPVDIAQRIAAGEVVVRPASVLKELIENSVDSEATCIDVVVASAGKELLEVIDDGTGIEKDDLKTAFLRHATSKITTDKDLFNLSTYGFRGEALASIASVSKVHLESTCRGTSEGYAIDNEGGVFSGQISLASPVEGTRICVRHLFYNVPARRKFLKSDHSEFQAIMNVFFDQALMNIDISFSLTHNCKKVLSLPACDDLVQRIGEVYGQSVSKSLLNFCFEQEGVCATGYASEASYSRSNRRAIRFFVNGRPVVDKFLSQSVYDLYSKILVRGRYPACFLFISLPRDQVDVNVHPAKTEIKFVNEYLVKRIVSQALKNMFDQLALNESLETSSNAVSGSFNQPLETSSNAVSGSFNQPLETSSKNGSQSFVLEDKKAVDERNEEKRSENIIQPCEDKKNKLQSFFSDSSQKKFQNSSSSLVSDYIKKHHKNEKEGLRPSQVQALKSNFSQKKYYTLPALDDQNKVRTHPNRQMVLNPCLSNSSSCSHFIPEDNKGFVHSSLFRVKELYVINENKEGLVVIDQHATHERVLYEKFKDIYLNQEAISQSLLFPIKIEVLSDEKELFKKIQDPLLKIGFEIEIVDHIFVHKVPALVKDKNIEHILYGLLDDVTLWGEERFKEGSEESFDFVIATMACRSAIKAGDRVTAEEWSIIIEQLSHCQDPHTCPHGRPTQIVIPFLEIEKKFRRLKS